MGRHFFLGSILPSIELGNNLEIGFEDLMELFRNNLKNSDLEKVSKIRCYIDLKNVRSLLAKEPLDVRGNLTEKELDEALVNQEGLTGELYEYLESYETLEEQLSHFSWVFMTFFKDMEKKEKGFLKFYFNFEREWRLILTGYRSKKLGVDPSRDLQHEDFTDPLVAQIIAQKEAAVFEFPFGYEDLNEKIKGVEGNPMQQYQLMAGFQLERIADATQDRPFSSDFILGYLVQHMIVEDWQALDRVKGNESLTEIVKGSL